jgi:hypothetical protein
VFQVGPGGELADALVTVTHYQGQVVPDRESVRIEASRCQWDRRTVTLMVGQRLEVFNHDADPYLPRVIGIPTAALRVALPGAAAIPFSFPKVGRFLLQEDTRPHMNAEVFVLAYPTAAVTDREGRFEISGIPVGEVHVTAFAPRLGKTSEQIVKVSAEHPLTLDFTLTFSQAEFAAEQKQVP